MSVPPPRTEATAALRIAITAHARAADSRPLAAIQALILALLTRVLGLDGAALRRHLAARHVAAPSPWFVGPADPAAGLLLRLAACLAITNSSDPDAPIPRPLRRGSPDILIALAHMPAPRNRARPARTRPLRPRQARDPPAATPPMSHP